MVAADKRPPLPLCQIARYNERDASSSGPCNRSLVENAEDAAIRQRETEEMRADLEAARNEVACYAGEIQKSKELEVVVRNELHTAQLALRQSELKVAELNGNLATAEHEKALGTAAVEELRLESARLKRTMEVVHSAAEGDTMRDISDALKDELKELRTQLAAMAKERWVKNTRFLGFKVYFSNYSSSTVFRFAIFSNYACIEVQICKAFSVLFGHGPSGRGATCGNTAGVTHDAGRASTRRWGL